MRLVIFLFVVLVVGGCVGQSNNSITFNDVPSDRVRIEEISTLLQSKDIVIRNYLKQHTSGSMVPFIGVGSSTILMEHDKAVQISPIKVGDIITFESTGEDIDIFHKTVGSMMIFIIDLSRTDTVNHSAYSNSTLHRVVEIGHDEKGKYYITKGDANRISDAWDEGKIREDQIQLVVVGVIY